MTEDIPDSLRSAQATGSCCAKREAWSDASVQWRRATVTHIAFHESGTDEARVETLVYARLDRSGTEICWHLNDYDKLDHAYAMTVHKSQGLTVEHAFYLVSETTDRRSAYVAFTRSKTACPFYLSRVRIRFRESGEILQSENDSARC